MFSEKDLAQITERGSDPNTVEKQLKNFRQGFPYLHLVKPATIDDGIVQLNDSQVAHYKQRYEDVQESNKIQKFVPASGAASRMFKELYKFKDEYSGSREDIDAMKEGGTFEFAGTFFKNLKKFAFYEDLKATLYKHGKDLEELLQEKDYGTILDYFLDEKGMNYGNLPKGLLKFHRYEEENRTSMEEHLVEGAYYCINRNQAAIHLTVSPEHFELFREHLEKVKPDYESRFDITFNVAFSTQKPSTDTIAVDMDNEPFRLEDGSLLFRPGGHGALLENLNDLDADIVFIKNIDNVVPDRLKDPTTDYKKVLGGILTEYRKKIFKYLEDLEEDISVDDDLLNEIQNFLEQELCLLPPEDFDTMDQEERINYFYQKLNRPLRVCGMVKNEGEPGGGPFWAENEDDTVSLQIVEKSQIETEDQEQAQILEDSTHFNPVDIACAIKDYKGNKFDLLNYRDQDLGIIAHKTKDGKDLKAQELPGLWNGSMAFWNTIFVEVPIVTFNPVKTINDLLRDEHQG